MEEPPIPTREAERLADLRALRILDTDPEERFDRFTRIARRFFDVPIALVSLVDANRQWFKSRDGLDPTETPRAISFCGHAILDAEPFVISDAHADERFSDNPLVVGPPHVRFYAGVPLTTRQGNPIGTLCLIDHEPRSLSADELELLADLAGMVEHELESVRTVTTDELTGISNRRGLRTLGEHAMALSRRLALPVTLVFFDLDEFKGINDDHGHRAGDEALTRFARLLLSTFRDADVVARLGGDEFCVLLTGATRDSANLAVGRLEAAVRAFNEGSGNEWALRFSAGAVEYDPLQFEGLDALIDAADHEMYVAKRG